MLETAAAQISEAQINLREQVGAPENYIEEQVVNGITFSANAPVIVPNVETAAVVKTTGLNFSQKKINQILMALHLPSETLTVKNLSDAFTGKPVASYTELTISDDTGRAFHVLNNADNTAAIAGYSW